MQDNLEQLRTATRIISKLTRICRQTIVYMDGISCMDKVKIKKSLQAAIKESDKFINSR